MNKHFLIIVIISFLLLVFGLSGCIEEIGETGTDKIKLLVYSVETQKKSGYEKIADGFVYSEEAYRYVVSGTVKNVAGEMLNHVKITVKFYDKNNSYLDSRVAFVYYLDDSHTGDFEIYYINNNEYFEFVDHVEFLISAS